MKKLTKYYNELDVIRRKLDNVIGELEETRDEIEDYAVVDMGRSMTSREQERYDAIDEQIEDIRTCIDNINYAMSDIENYCD